MRKIFNLALANIRKGKGQATSFIIIMAICSMLMTMGLVTSFDYAKSFDKKSKQLNAADFVISVRTTEKEFISQLNGMLENDNEIKQIQSQPVMLASTTFDFADKPNNRFAALFDESSKQEINKLAMVEKTDKTLDNPIILPYLFKLGGGFEIGDDFKLTLDNTYSFDFTVSGFYEDIYFSTINTTTMGFILPHETYTDIEKQIGATNNGILYSLKVTDPAKSEAQSLKYKDIISDVLPENTLIDVVCYWIVKASRTLTASIGSLVIVGFAILLTLVALIVVNFRIKSSIDEDIKNIGALKAVGYTSGQIMLSFLVQFLTLGLAGGVIGIVCSFPAMPILSNMFAAQSGLVWKQLPTPLAVITTLLILSVAISTVAVMSAIHIKKIHPIVALRTGIQTHSFKKNYFPLDKTRIPLIASLSLKQLVIDMKQGVLTCIIMIIISFTSVFAVVMYYNFVIDSSAFMALGGAPYLHCMIVASTPQESDDIISDMSTRDDVDIAIRFMSMSIQYNANHSGIAYVSDEFEKIVPYNPVFIYDGRFPKHENEVAVNGLIAKTDSKQIGDRIMIGDSNNKYEYIITGFTQGSNYMGRDICMTSAAYRRIVPTYEPLAIVGFMKDVNDTNGLLNDVKNKYPNVLQATNFDELVRSTMSVYTSIVSSIATIICIVAILMVWLVLYLVINTMLIKRKREFGIQKTLGFTTQQLMLQNVTTVIPVVGIGALIGCVLGYFLINPFVSLLFSSIGISKTNLTVTPAMCIGLFVVIILIATLIATMLSRKIRHISPYSLITE